MLLKVVAVVFHACSTGPLTNLGCIVVMINWFALIICNCTLSYYGQSQWTYLSCANLLFISYDVNLSIQAHKLMCKFATACAVQKAQEIYNNSHSQS